MGGLQLRDPTVERTTQANLFSHRYAHPKPPNNFSQLNSILMSLHFTLACCFRYRSLCVLHFKMCMRGERKNRVELSLLLFLAQREILIPVWSRIHNKLSQIIEAYLQVMLEDSGWSTGTSIAHHASGCIYVSIYHSHSITTVSSPTTFCLLQKPLKCSCLVTFLCES